MSVVLPLAFAEAHKMTTDDHKPSVPRPVLAIDHTRTPYHNSLSPPAHPSDAQPKSPPGEAEEAQRSLLIDHTQPINPDIPHKDVLFIFSNFASYMKAPNQGATGVSDQELRHALRLLEHARDLQKRDKRSRVFVLHIKYRFIESSFTQASAKRIAPPFATMLDPVLKIDQRPSGAFSPSVPQAVFEHITRNICPPPRFIVWSQVGSNVTNLHMGIVSQWCAHAALPITILSPYETRIRKEEPEDLQEVIDIELYITGDVLSPLGLHSNSTTTGNGSTPGQHPSNPIWPVNLGSRRSSSVGWNSYYRAREKVMRQFGVITPSYGSSRRSIPRSTGSLGHLGIGGSAGPGDLEDLIDMLRLGDADQGNEDDAVPGIAT